MVIVKTLEHLVILTKIMIKIKSLICFSAKNATFTTITKVGLALVTKKDLHLGHRCIIGYKLKTVLHYKHHYLDTWIQWPMLKMKV